MTNNLMLVQDIKRYLHEATSCFDDSINVNLSDFSCEPVEVFFGLGILQAYGYLKTIGLMPVPDGHCEKNAVPITDITKEEGLKYAKVVLAKHFGKIDEKFELDWRYSDREVWVGKIFVKGFSPRGGAFMDAFAYTYNNSGKTLRRKDFKSVLGTKREVRLDTMITSALDTLSRNNVKWWYQELGSSKVRCERIYWKSKAEELDLVKEPKHYEWDPFEKGEWSDD